MGHNHTSLIVAALLGLGLSVAAPAQDEGCELRIDVTPNFSDSPNHVIVNERSEATLTVDAFNADGTLFFLAAAGYDGGGPLLPGATLVATRDMPAGRGLVEFLNIPPVIDHVSFYVQLVGLLGESTVKIGPIVEFSILSLAEAED
jgi:hypothetical protein